MNKLVLLLLIILLFAACSKGVPEGDTEPPGIPTDLVASDITTTSFTLSWIAPTDNVGVIGYEIYKNNVLDTTVTGSFILAGLEPNTTYSVAIKAKDAAGNVSGASESLDVTTKEINNGFPHPTTTGIPEGTTLTPTNVRTPPNGSVQTGMHFTNGLDLSKSHNITFQSCKISGRVNTGYNTSTCYGLEFYDCEFDGNNEGVLSGFGDVGVKLRRCYHWNSRTPVYITAGVLDMEDCYIGNLYGSGTTHCAGLSINGCNGSRIVHNTIFGEFRPGGDQTVEGGGISGALVLYSHGSFWGPTDDVLCENNLLQAKDAAFTVYWGTWEGSGDTGELTNCRLINNQFRKVEGRDYSAVYGDIFNNPPNPKQSWGSGTEASGNVYEGTDVAIAGQ